jgi:hypothetical protein
MRVNELSVIVLSKICSKIMFFVLLNTNKKVNFCSRWWLAYLYRLQGTFHGVPMLDVKVKFSERIFSKKISSLERMLNRNSMIFLEK